MQELQESCERVLSENISEESCIANISAYSNAATAEPAKYRKGSFSSKFSNANSKAAAYFVENAKIVDRTINAFLEFFGIEHKSNIHTQQDLLTTMHISSGAYDLVYGEKSPYSALGSVFFATNAHTDFFASEQNIAVKCSIEGAYAFLRGYPSIPSLISPSTTLVGASINFALCVNDELNEGDSRPFIDKGLKFTKAMLQGSNPVFVTFAKGGNPLTQLSEVLNSGDLLWWKGGEFNSNVIKTIAYAKAYWNAHDFIGLAQDALAHEEENCLSGSVNLYNHTEEL